MKKRRLNKKIIENNAIKNILFGLFIAVFGFLLLNITFIIDAIYQGLVRRIVGLIIPFNPDSKLYWFPLLMHGSFFVIIGIVSWFVFKSKLKDIYKATYMIVPLAAVYVTIGMFLNKWPIAIYSIGILFGISVLYYLYRTKMPWLYYYTLILISLLMFIVQILGIDI